MTRPDVDEGGAQILAGFGRFKGGIVARPAEVLEASHVLATTDVAVAAPTVDGRVPGEVASVDFWVGLQQLELAPREDLLCSCYDPNEDPDFDRLKASLDALGDQVPALSVLPARRDVVIAGARVPMFLIYDQPEVYYALIGLGRARARVHIPPVTSPGQILLRALAEQGQLRRPPSTMEVCLAARRLREAYGYTLVEIAQMQARNPEDNTPPSVTQVHYQILVAGLPPVVRDLLHKRHILWTHARKIAEYCGEDAGLAAQLATLVAQSGRVSVDQLGHTIHRLKDGLCRLQTDEDGLVRVVPVGMQIAAMDAPASPAAKSTVFYQRLMAAPPTQVRRMASNFNVALIPADTPDQVALAPQALDDLRTWLNNRRGSTSVREVEATLLGYLEAVRSAGVRQGLVSKDGVLTSVVDAGTNPASSAG